MFSFSSIAKSWLATTFCLFGLALAIYLSLLKLYALPCIGPGNCHAILYSSYGSVFGLPVGIFGALLWTAAIVVPDQTKRAVLLSLLAVGTAIFMVIQFGVLRAFCLYCTLHAVAAWGALAFHGGNPRWWAVVAAAALAAGGFQFNRQYLVQASATAIRSPQRSTLADNPAGLAWLGTIHPRSPTLIVSLNCAACLDLLEELTGRSYAGRKSGPALYLKTNDANRALTVGFVASVLAQRDLSRREAFLVVTTSLLAEKDACLASPDAAAARLAALFPSSVAHQPDAERIVASQTTALSAAGVGDVTPLLIPRNGLARALFEADELFPH